MKRDWDIKKLGEICEFGNGLWTGKKPPFINVGVIRNTNFTKEGTLDDTDIAFLDVELSQFVKRKLKYGDIILEKSGGGPKQPVGRVIIFDKVEGNFSFSNFTSVIRIKDCKQIDFKYLHRYLFHSYLSGVTETMQSHSTGIRNLKFDDYKEIQIPLPPFSVQQGIVAILDEAFATIAKAKANAEQNLKNARELFESVRKQTFFTLDGVAGKVPIASVCKEVFAGGDAPKENFSFEKNERFKIPIVANAVKDNGLYGYTDQSRVNEPAITIAARGSGTGHTEIRYEPFFPIVRLIVLIPDIEMITLEYLKYSIQNLQILSNGSAIPQLTVPMIREYSISLPTIPEQCALVKKLDAISAETQTLQNIYQQKINDMEEFKRSILQKAFNGELKGA